MEYLAKPHGFTTFREVGLGMYVCWLCVLVDVWLVLDYVVGTILGGELNPIGWYGFLGCECNIPMYLAW